MLFRMIVALLIGVGLWMMVDSLLHPYSPKAARALENLAGHKVTFADRLILPIAHRLEPHIHLAQYRRQELADNLSIVGDMTPEAFTARNLTASGLIVLLALAVFPVSLPVSSIFSLVLIIYAVYLYSYRKSGLTDKAKKYKKQREAEMPRFASYIVQAIKDQHDLYAIISEYRPTAGAAFGHVLDKLLFNTRTKNVESALQDFAAEMGSPLCSDLVMGLIGTNRGEDMREFLAGVEARYNEQDIAMMTQEAEQRPEKLAGAQFLSLFGMIAIYMVALGVYAYQLYKMTL